MATQPLPETVHRARSLRWLIAGGGIAVLVVLGGVLYVRRVDPVEVAATLLFVPIFIGIVLWRIPGGLAAAAVAAAAYAALRYPAMQMVGADRFIGLLAARTAAYFAFGGIGGWAMGRVRRSFEKLDLYDQVDDDTGMGNARYFVQTTELEQSRSQRYQTVFSVVAVDVPAEPLNGLSRSSRRRLLRDLGADIRQLVRTVDRPVHAWDGTVHRIAVVLPETSRGGADVFASRFRDWLVTWLEGRGAGPEPAQVRSTVIAFPGDDDALASLQEVFAALVEESEASHPET